LSIRHPSSHEEGSLARRAGGGGESQRLPTAPPMRREPILLLLLDEPLSLADRVVLMRAGRIEQSGAPREGEVSVPVRVAAVAYHGAGLRIVVEVGALRLNVLGAADEPWRPGDAARLCWSSASALVL
jgi:hypothetical protein